MAKQLRFSDDARQSLLRGIETVTKAVVTTLGPRGRNIALDKKWGAPNVVHDGVSVAKEIELPDPFENMGAQLVKEVASKTNDVAGDGTTTATLIAESLTREGMKAVLQGVNPMDLKREIENSISKVVDLVESQARPINTKEDIEKVATVSAQDEVIGKLITEAIEKVGKDGVVTVEEGKGRELEVEYKEGMEFDKGYASAYFVTNPDRMEAEIENPYILLTDKKISSIQDLLPFLEKFVKVSKNLVIIADEIEGEALATLVLNRLKGSFNVLAIKAPGFGDRRKEMLEDIAILTGGTIISEEIGRTFESIEIVDLGQADKVWADRDNARIIGGKGSKKAISDRVESIKRQIKASDSDFDKEKFEERLAKLSGGVAVINVGAATEIEMTEKKERVKDAVGATKAAIEGGIVAGGGAILFEAREVLPVSGGYKPKEGRHERVFRNIGEKVVYQALGLPMLKILSNAYGEERARFILGRITSQVESNLIKQAESKQGLNFGTYKFANVGYDVMRDKDGDMFVLGIIDPVKVVKAGLQNAASVAMMVLTTEGLVTDLPEEKKEPAMPPGGGMEY